MLTWPEFNEQYKMEEIERYGRLFSIRQERKDEYKHYKKEFEVNTINIPTCGEAKSFWSGDCVKTGKTAGVNYITANGFLAPLSDQTVPCVSDYAYGCKQEGITPMNYASASVTTAPTEAQTQRKYLEQRLYEVYQDKREPLEAKFGLIDDEAPRTPKELDERIKAGKFSIRGLDSGDKNDYRYWSAGELIQWRDPAKKADQEGYAAAKADLKAKRQAALDTIKIDDVKAGLDAVKALETWEPIGAAQ